MPNLIHDFGVNKVNKLPRSRWSFPVRTKTAFKQGVLVPLGFVDVIPSSRISCDFDNLVRLALTPAKPTMGDSYFSYGAYFVPYRILFKDYEDMFGDGKPSEWSNPQEWVMPTMSYSRYGNTSSVNNPGSGYDAIDTTVSCVSAGGHILSKPGSLADYLGLPLTMQATNNDNIQVNIAPFAAYARIWSDFWRDENYQNEDPDLEKIKALPSGSSGTHANLGFKLHYANRFHDYFTSLLPNTQKGTEVSAFSHLISLPELYALNPSNPSAGAMKFGNDQLSVVSGALGSNANGVNTGSSGVTAAAYVRSTNLGVDISINELRTLFALQRAKERNGRTGSRYVEAMLGTFEAQLPNAIAQRAEFLGGNTIQLNMTSVPSTSSDTAGKLGAFSATKSSQGVFTKVFNEPGLIMLVGCVRVKHTYCQGIAKSWLKKRRYDWYDPAFANISEQPIQQMELCVNTDDYPTDVIGFQEPWAEYRKPVDQITGLLRSSDNRDLTAWVYQDKFNAGLSLFPQTYYPEDRNEIAKTTIDYNEQLSSWQFIGDFKANFDITAPIPLYSIPGLIDHIGW